MYTISFKEFICLDPERKEEIFLSRAIVLLKREEGCFLYILYQLAGFYIELVYNRNQQAVSKFNIYETCDQLDSYLQEIKLNEIYNLLQNKNLFD
jgi:hypothetical protein